MAHDVTTTHPPFDPRSATYEQIKADFWPIMQPYIDVEGAVLPILHEAQHRYGWVSEPTVRVIAEFLHTTPPSVYAVVTYYHELSIRPPADVNVIVCAGPACRAEGGPELQAALEEATGVTVGDLSRDLKFGMANSACVGICMHAPAAVFNGRLVGRLKPERVRALIDEAARAARSSSHAQGEGR